MKQRRPWVVEYRVPNYDGKGGWSDWRFISRCATHEGADNVRYRWEFIIMKGHGCEYRIEKRPVVIP